MSGLEDAALVARQAGLSPVGRRPSLGTYIGQILRRRHLIHVLASSRLLGGVEGSRLGLIWLVLGPLLNALVYFLIFGVILGATRGVDNFVAYVVIGVLSFSFLTQIETSCASSIRNNRSFIRSVHFPKAVLPLSTAQLAVYQFIPSLVVMILFAVVTGEPVTWRWLLVLPALALTTLFATALGLWLARLAARSLDVQRFLPFINRTWLFASGVIFNIKAFTDPPLETILLANPGAVYVDLFRGALMEGDWASTTTWWLGGAYALLFVPALIWFWRAEGTYGRE